MFVVDLHYTAPLERIDEAMGEHVRFLKKYYSKNVFVASGRKVPRTGGIILAVASSMDEIRMIMETDPFYTRKLTSFTITEFRTSQHHPDLTNLLH